MAGCAACVGRSAFLFVVDAFVSRSFLLRVKEARGARHKCSVVVAIRKNNYYRGWLAPAGVLGAHLLARKGERQLLLLIF